MENTSFDKENENEYYQQYYCIIIQYTTKINSEKLMKLAKQIQNKNSSIQLGKKNFHFRLVTSETSFELTGYQYNAVTPFALKTKIPIILSDNIDQLESKFFYLGGGAVDLKIRIGIEEFKNKYESKIFIGDIVYK